MAEAVDLKRLAAERAAEYLEGAGVVGLGTGSTAERFLEVLAEGLRAGRLGPIVGIPTSTRTEHRARELGIPLSSLEAHPGVDVAVDGADEVDGRLDLLKGWGGALTREKIVAAASRCYVIIVDDSKLVERLGTRGPLPVEVLPFGWRAVQGHLERLGAEVVRRRAAGGPCRTDDGNYILDCRFPDGIVNAAAVARVLERTPGVVEHGLFLGMASRVVVASAQGVRVLERGGAGAGGSPPPAPLGGP